MKYLAILSLAVSIAHSQTVMGGLAGTVVDGKHWRRYQAPW